MQFDIEQLPLDTILGAIQHYTWEQAWGLSNAAYNFLRYRDVRVVPFLLELQHPEYASKSDTAYEFIVPPTDSIPVDRLEVAIFNLNTIELTSLHEALKHIMRTRQSVIKLPSPTKPDEQNQTPIRTNFAFSLPSSLIYPENDYSVIEKRYEEETPEPQRKADDLMHQARVAKSEGNLQECRELADQALKVIEDSGLPTFEIRAQRELALIEPGSADRSGVLKIWEEAANYYRKNGDNDRLISVISKMLSFSYDDKDESFRLIAEGMQLAKQLNQPTFYWKREQLRAERLGEPYEPKKHIKEELEIHEEEMEHYLQHNDSYNILQTLLNISAIASQAGNSQLAITNLDLADEYLNSITESDIEVMSRNSVRAESKYQVKYLLLLRYAEIAHRRKNLTNTIVDQAD